jgi:hypothetical protein
MLRGVDGRLVVCDRPRRNLHRRRKTSRDVRTERPHSIQGKSKVRKKLTTYACSLCMDQNLSALEERICYSKPDTVRFVTNINLCHDE